MIASRVRNDDRIPDFISFDLDNRAGRAASEMRRNTILIRGDRDSHAASFEMISSQRP
jgi:hypothetical protein